MLMSIQKVKTNMNNTNPFLSAKKIKKNYKAQIILNPVPNNCDECPFYYMPNPYNKDSWYEHWDCYLEGIDDITGISLNRPKSCPL